MSFLNIVLAAPAQPLANVALWIVELRDRTQAPLRVLALIAQQELAIERLRFTRAQDGAAMAITVVGLEPEPAERLAAKMRRVIGVRDVALRWRSELL